MSRSKKSDISTYIHGVLEKFTHTEIVSNYCELRLGFYPLRLKTYTFNLDQALGSSIIWNDFPAVRLWSSTGRRINRSFDSTD